MKYIIEYNYEYYTKCIENGKKLIHEKAYVTSCNTKSEVVTYSNDRCKAKKYSKSTVERIMRIVKHMHFHDCTNRYKIIEVEE